MAENVQRIPPLITDARRAREPALVALGVAAALIVARVSEHWHLPFMKCTFKALTTLPCATCGGTRALRAMTRLDMAEAFWLNPLVTLATGAAMMWFIFWLVAPDWTLRLKAAISIWPLLKIGILLALLNWIFLLLFLPR